MEKCGYRSLIACSARGYFCSIDVNLTMPTGSIRLRSLFLTLPTRVLTGQQVISSAAG
jgi:hypothetical protein